MISASEDDLESKSIINEIFSTLGIFTGEKYNSFKLNYINKDNENINLVKSRALNNYFVLNTKELASLVHLPTTYVKTPSINWVSARNFEPPANLSIVDLDSVDSDLTPI